MSKFYIDIVSAFLSFYISFSMKKGFFVPICIYGLVIQMLILWYLMSNNVFYKVAIINLAVLVIVRIITLAVWDSWKRPASSQKSEYIEREVNDKEEIIRPSSVRRGKVKKTWQWWVLIISLIVAVILMFMIGEIITFWSPLIASIFGFLLYVVVGKVLDLRWFSSIKKLGSAWIYYFIMFGCVGYALAYQCGFLSSSSLPNFLWWTPTQQTTFNQWWNTTTNITSGSQIDSWDYLFEGTGKVISGSGDEALTGNTVETTGKSVSGSAQEPMKEPEIIPNKPSDTNVEQTSVWQSGKKEPVTMIQALKHLFDSQKVSLSSKKTTSFEYISSSNANYAYAQTAYEKSMVGKNSNFSQQITCGTYMVFKWLLAKRSVGSYTDVKAAYFNKANELWETGWCSSKDELLMSDKL